MILSLVCTLAATSPRPSITITRLRTMDSLHAIAYTAAPSGSKFVVSLEDRTIRLMDASTGNTIRHFDGHPQPAYAVAFSPNGQLLATGDETARIWIWNVSTGLKLKEFDRSKGHIRGIQNLSFSADGKLIASTGKDDVIKVWEVTTGKMIKTILGNGMNFYSAAYLPKGALFAAPTLSGGGVRFYRSSDYSPYATMFGHANQGILDVAFSLTGNRAVTAGRDNVAAVWDVFTRKRIQDLRGHQDWVIHTAMSPNGRLAASSSSDRTVRIWDLNTYQSIATLDSQSYVGAPLTFTRDGKYLITANASDGVQINSIMPPQGVAQPTVHRRRRR